VNQKTSGEAQKIRVMRIIARMNVGGPAVQVSGLMRGFDAQVFEQELVTGYCAANEADYLEKVATDVKSIRIDGLGRSIKPRADLTALFAIVKEIRRFKPDVIHTHTAKAGVVGRIASILSGRKSVRVHTFHGHLLNGYFGAGKTKLVILVEKFLALFTDQLLAVGTKVKDDLLAVGIGNQSKFGVMPPGLQLAQVPSQSFARHELGLSADATYCAFIGRITQIKRPDRFLDVVAEIKSRGIDLQFIVAGAGELLQYCQDRAKVENLPVTFLGWREDIEVVLAAADFVLLTSDNEGTPLSLIQVCSVKYMLEPGFYQGALYVAYGLGVALFLLIWLLCTLFFPLLSVWIQISLVAISSILLGPLLFSLSKIIYANIFIPLKKNV
jgi:glycosyltransferase involved in cell wall biosynthesis